MGKLDGKIAIVTGGAGGIGAATAGLFAREGASVMVVDRDARALESMESDRVATVAVDVSNPEAVDLCVAKTLERFGGIDVVFANAGVEGRVCAITDYPLAELDRVLAINVRGPFLAIQRTAPHLSKRGGGSIIVTSSVAGYVGSPGLSAYVASKHAVMGLVKTAAIELAPLGIRVNALNPGPIENRMMRSIEDQAAPGKGDQVKQGFLAMVPMRRYGTNEEMARMALFLASDDSSYCTGASFLGDGGFVAG